MLLLNLLYDVVIIIVVFLLGVVLKSILPNSKARLFYDQIWVFLFFLNHSGGNITVDQVVTTNCGCILDLIDEFPVNFRLECCTHLLFIENGLRIVWAWSRSLFLLRIFRSCLCWAELSPVASLNLIDKLILHGISRLIWSWSWYFDVIIYQGRTSLFNLYLDLFVLSCFLTEIKSNIIASRTKTSLWSFFRTLGCSIKTTAWTKTGSWFSRSCFRNLRNLHISTRPRSCIINVLVFTIFIRVDMCRRSSLFWIDPALSLILILLFMDGFIDDGSLSLIHSSHSLTCKVGCGFVVVKRVDGGDLVWTRTDIDISFYLISFFRFRLRPRYSPSLHNCLIGVVLPWTYLILFFSLEILNRWLIKF